MRLLCIANPEAYHDTETDIPLSYARLACHPAIELYHADTRAMLTAGEQIAAVPVPAGFQTDDFTRLAEQRTELFSACDFDAAFCRTLKPFPAGYMQRLTSWSQTLRFVNDPAGITRALQLDFFLQTAKHYIPPAIVTANADEGGSFLARYGIIVAKLANSCGGRGVYRIDGRVGNTCRSDNAVEGLRMFDNFTQLFAELSRQGSEPLLLMRYLPRVIEGDRRIVVVDGQIIGSYLRRSANQHWVQNVSTGGSCERQAVAADDAQLVAATCGPYKAAGIHILGYDLLRDDDGRWCISEINAGNIGGLFRLETMGVPDVTERFAQWLCQFSRRAKVPARLPDNSA